MPLRSRVLAQYPGAELIAIAPDEAFPLPSDLLEWEASESLRKRINKAFPQWDPPPRRRYPELSGFLLMAAGLALAALALGDSLGARELRNDAWKAWLKDAELRSAAPSIHDQSAKYLKAQGVPIPELFARLAKAWGGETRIIDLEWSQGKLTLTANSSSALGGIGKLNCDPWFRDIRAEEIRTQKDGSEVFVIEGDLSIDL